MGLDVPARVHIMPVGYEYERIVEPAEEFRADKVVLLGHEKDAKGDPGVEKLEESLHTLENNNIEVISQECDIFDLYSSMSAIAEIITEHEGDEVYVNVSTGSKVTAIAGMITSMVLECTPYYVRAKNYSKEPEDIVETTELPTYPIDAPYADQVNVMNFIEIMSERRGPPTKGEIIQFSDYYSLDYISRDVDEKGKYRILDTYIIEPLEADDYIEIYQEGRNKVVSLTEQGQGALEAFQWLIDTEITEHQLDQMLSDNE